MKKQPNDSKWYYKTVRVPVRISVNSGNFKKNQGVFNMIKYPLVKLTALMLIIGLNWTGLSAVLQTYSFFNNTEDSSGNIFEAGVLNFELQPSADFPVVCPKESAERTISIVNYGNPFKYIASSVEFSGEVCDFITLEANVDGGEPEYIGPLTGFNSGLLDFSDPDEWIFKATFNPDLPTELLGQTCIFKFVFDGSQTKNDLPFGQGFSDIEEITNNITSKACYENCELQLTKTANSGEVGPGEEIIYHLTFDNIGSKVCTGGGVRLKDTFDKNKLQYINYTSTRKPKSFSKGSGYAEWNFGSIYPDDPIIEIDLTMKVSSCAKCNSIITNSAKYWSDQTNWGNPVFADTQVVCGPLPEIVINEFLPNPVGSDKARKPNGEWVELYNKGTDQINVAGWVLYDENNNNELPITSYNTNTGSTTIAGHGFLVVYRNGDYDFALDNIGGDAVRLYDGAIISGANLIDSYTYPINAPEGKSFARIPDGSDNWVDPIPTPGEPNLNEEEATAVFGIAISEEGEEGYEEAADENEIPSSEIIGGGGAGGESEQEIIEVPEDFEEQPVLEGIEETTELQEPIIIEEPQEEVQGDNPVEEPVEESVEEPAEELPSENELELQPEPDNPVIEEQPVIVPENNSELQAPPADNPGSGGDDENSGEDTADNTALEESAPAEDITR